MKSRIELEINNFKGLIEYFKEGAELQNQSPRKKSIQPMQNRDDKDPAESLYVKDIVGYDGDFKRNSKIWKDQFKSQVCYEDQRKDYSVWRKSRIKGNNSFSNL